MLRHYDVEMVPMLNPNGYIHTFKRRGRHWRKSRSGSAISRCKGVDLNLNLDACL